MTDGGRVVVAGAGLAGFRAVTELRERGFTGQITLIGAETRPPYDRPPLSKKVLTDDGVDPSLQADFGALDVDFRPGEAATGMDAQTLATDRDKYPYDRLILATGAVPVALPGPGRQRFLRNYDDALALRALFRPGLRLAIVGAGWIGAELATAAAAHGCQVTVVEAGPAPLAAALGAPVGAQTSRWYAAAGVRLQTGVAVESVQPRAASPWPAAGGSPRTRSSPRSGSARPPAGWRVRVSGWRTAWPSTPACGRPCPASTRWATAPRSSRGGSAGGCGSSTGTWPCTRPRWSRPTCSAATRYTTRCRTSGRSSSAGWCSTRDTTVTPSGWSGAVTRPIRPGRRAGSPSAGWWPS